MKWKKDTKQNKPVGSMEVERAQAESDNREIKRGEGESEMASEKVLVKREDEP